MAASSACSVGKERVKRRIPKLDAAGDAIAVRYDPHIVRQGEIDRARVAAAKIQHIVIHQGLNDGDRFLDAPIPFSATFGFENRVAEILVIGLVPMNRMLAELEMRQQRALLEQ